MSLTSKKYAPLGADGKVIDSALPASIGGSGIPDPVTKTNRDILTYVPASGGWIASRVAWTELTGSPPATLQLVSEKAAANGYASLDAAGAVPVAQLPPLTTVLTVPTTDVTIAANYCAVVADEYVMDATHELIFSDPSEMAVI